MGGNVNVVPIWKLNKNEQKERILKILILFSTKSVPGMISAHITNKLYNYIGPPIQIVY